MIEVASGTVAATRHLAGVLLLARSSPAVLLGAA